MKLSRRTKTPFRWASRTIYILLMTTLLAGSFQTNAQKFSIRAAAVPSITNTKVLSDGSVPEWVIETFEDIEKAKYTTGARLMGACNFNERLSLLAGVDYQDLGNTFKSNFDTLILRDGRELGEVRFTQQIRYVGVPIHALFRFGERMYLQTGPSIAFNLANFQRVKTTFTDGETLVENHDEVGKDTRKVNLNFTVAFGFELPVGDVGAIFFQPEIAFMALPLYEETNLNRFAYTAGLGVGFAFGN